MSYMSSQFVCVYAEYCESALKWPLPGAYISLDASKTWIVYWALHSLSLLNARNVIDAHAEDIIDFLSRCQNPTGGFGGGPGQISHLATTYPAVAALAIIGTERAISVVNRQTLRTWLVSLKDPEGGFKIHDDGEVDMRSCYCAIICASMMGILDEEVASGVSEHILSCQRYDGGFAGEPGAESHSGYTYCALAALALLGTLKDADLMKLMAWLSHRQTPAGGFNGRANKLVDVCYSFWVSGSLVLLKLGLWQQAKTRSNVHVPLPGTLFCSPTPLQKYITFCCQPSLQGWDEETRTILDSSKKGGLCDKPGTKPDFYHTCYGLSGLSIVQEYSKLQVQESEKDQHLQEQLPKLNVSRYTHARIHTQTWIHTHTHSDVDG